MTFICLRRKRGLLVSAGHIFFVLENALLACAATASHRQQNMPSASPKDGSKPNIIFFLTDDQDVTAGSLNYMPNLHKIFREGGTEFRNFFVPTGLCCPSRATILRGQYCHNHKIYDNGDLNNATYQSGAMQKFLQTGMENDTIATILQSEGFETALVGKYINGYNANWVSHVPPGWDHWMGMTHPAFYGPRFSRNGKPLNTSSDTYQTDYLNDIVHSFLTEERNESKPFFLYVAPFAPHGPATPAKRHEHLFQRLQAPRFPSYNPSDDIQQKKPSWIKRMPALTEDQLSGIDNFYRNRLRSLQAVDEFLLNITDTLESLSLQESTYIFYMGDNGQHLGDYRLPAGKRQAYETDVLVPFLVRGPGIPGGNNVSEVAQSVDLLPTWLDLAGSSREDGDSHLFDGKSIKPLLKGEYAPEPRENKFRSVALLEMYGGSSTVGLRYKNMSGYYANQFYNNTYQALRVINGSGWAADANWLYVEWCTGEQEFYNLTNDPHEIDNLAESVDWQLLHHLSALLAGMGGCVGSECYSMRFDKNDQTNTVAGESRDLSLLSEKIRRRLRCHNPPDMPSSASKLRRMPFAVNEFVPAPFDNGFPFSDGEIVSEYELKVWEQYKHYFY